MTIDPGLERIRELNDEARRYLTDGKLFLTRGVAALPVDDQAAILERVRTFNDFSPANDPWGEHDFGVFEHNGHRIFWKVDAYDREMRFGSPDPADPRVTRRVLTIMLAGERAPGKLACSSEVEDLTLPYRAGCG